MLIELSHKHCQTDGHSLLHVPEPCVNIGLIWAYGKRMIQKLQPTTHSTECLVVIMAKNYKLSPF